MKKQVHPGVIIGIAVTLIAVLVVFGIRTFGGVETPTASKDEKPPQEKILNGVKVPAGVPSDYMNNGNDRTSGSTSQGAGQANSGNGP